ncbi:MAG: hypothetical protein JWQ40_2688 [Segetibacter sp.]|nr:hypothetical protein [Segetibacter sp.]
MEKSWHVLYEKPVLKKTSFSTPDTSYTTIVLMQSVMLDLFNLECKMLLA